jgi:tripartite-type tricarboxylate transporter receptor subunit TctC
MLRSLNRKGGYMRQTGAGARLAVRVGMMATMLAIAGHSWAQTSNEQDWPRKTLRIVCPFAPGGATDIFARVLAQKLQVAINQNIVVDNRAGAGGAIGTDLVTKSTADGHILLFTSDSPITIGPNLSKTIQYNPTKDLTPVGKVVSVINVLVANPKLKFNGVSDLITQAKARDVPFKYASSGTGAFGHLTGELFKASTGIDLVHVPYKGGGPGITALIGGETDVSFATLPSVFPHVKSGRLTLLAVSNFKRTRLLPDVPTIAEAGIRDFGVDNWHGLLAPPGLPRKVLLALNKEVSAIVNSSDFAKLVNAQGAEADYVGLEQFNAFIAKDLARWKSVIDKNQIRTN